MRDPKEYFTRLRAVAPSAWIVAEKILEPGEPLPETWPVAGTTGYDFLNDVAGLFVHSGGEAALTQFYAAFTGEPTEYAHLLRDKKLFVLREGTRQRHQSPHRPAPPDLRTASASA